MIVRGGAFIWDRGRLARNAPQARNVCAYCYSRFALIAGETPAIRQTLIAGETPAIR
jgi:hypothetical protein